MKSGKGAVCKSLMIFTACIAANAGGRADQISIGAGWGWHTESTARDATMIDCEGIATPPSRALSFVTIDFHDEAAEQRRLVAQGSLRSVSFEWDPQTGELSFNSDELQTPLTPRALRPSSTISRLATSSCESR